MEEQNSPSMLLKENTAVITDINRSSLPTGLEPMDLLRLENGENINVINRVDVFRVVRLFTEALEIAFFLCNALLEDYGLAKILDIVNQIIPSAFVYDNSNWVFYENQSGERLCVCEKFGINCLHRRDKEHCLNMDPLPENLDSYFKLPISGKLYPLTTSVSASPVFVDTLRAYEVKMHIVVQPLVINEQGLKFLDNTQEVVFSVESRYGLTYENSSLRGVFVHFGPNRINKFIYSSYFDTTKQLQVSSNENSCRTQIPYTVTVVSIDVPKFTLHPRNTRIPVFKEYEVERFEYYLRLLMSKSNNISAKQPNTFGMSFQGCPIDAVNLKTNEFLSIISKVPNQNVYTGAMARLLPNSQQPNKPVNNKNVGNSNIKRTKRGGKTTRSRKPSSKPAELTPAYHDFQGAVIDDYIASTSFLNTFAQIQGYASSCIDNNNEVFFNNINETGTNFFPYPTSPLVPTFSQASPLAPNCTPNLDMRIWNEEEYKVLPVITPDVIVANNTNDEAARIATLQIATNAEMLAHDSDDDILVIDENAIN